MPALARAFKFSKMVSPAGFFFDDVMGPYPRALCSSVSSSVTKQARLGHLYRTKVYLAPGSGGLEVPEYGSGICWASGEGLGLHHRVRPSQRRSSGPASSYKARSTLAGSPPSGPHNVLVTSLMLRLQTPPTGLSFCHSNPGSKRSQQHHLQCHLCLCHTLMTAARFPGPAPAVQQTLSPEGSAP